MYIVLIRCIKPKYFKAALLTCHYSRYDSFQESNVHVDPLIIFLYTLDTLY